VSTAHAVSGPMAAPTVSSARWSPKSRPRRSGVPESAMSASRGAVRTPLPNLSATRSARTAGQPGTTASSGLTTLESV
jgi:hypothetical protein